MAGTPREIWFHRIFLLLAVPVHPKGHLLQIGGLVCGLAALCLGVSTGHDGAGALAMLAIGLTILVVRERHMGPRPRSPDDEL